MSMCQCVVSLPYKIIYIYIYIITNMSMCQCVVSLPYKIIYIYIYNQEYVNVSMCG